MKVMGIKVSTKDVRYAVLLDDQNLGVSFLNKAANKVVFPKEYKNRFDRAQYLLTEFTRLIQENAPDRIVVKLFEPSSPGFRKFAVPLASFETAIALAAMVEHVSVAERYFANIKLNSKTVEGYVTTHIAKQGIGWDSHIVDALAVALKELGK